MEKAKRICYTHAMKKSLETTEKPELVMKPEGLTLVGGGMEIHGDFTRMLPRLRRGNLQGETLVKAAKIKGAEGPVKILDATAGLGEDSLLLASAGFDVVLFEKDPVIAALLRDALSRASEDPELRDIASRMEFHEGDSISGMSEFAGKIDVVFLDPMFPERQKTGLVKKKFQLLHQLEKPCDDEEGLLSAAFAVHPKKIIIKRPRNGPYLAEKKPDFSYDGKNIRYDCFLLDK